MARDFPGTAGSYVAAPDSAPLGSELAGTVLTLAAWFRGDSFAANPIVAGKSNSNSQGGGYAMALSGSKLWGRVDDNAFPGDAVTGATTVGTAVWAHGAIRKSGTGAGALRCYLNGVQDAAAASSKSITDNALGFRIGSFTDNDSQRFDGLICEVAVWGVALTDDEILALGKGVSPALIRPSAFKGYWPVFGIGSPEPDWSGKGGNGVVTGTPAASALHAPVGSPVAPYF